MQDTPLDCSALEARQACVPGSHGTVTIQERVLSGQPPSGTHREQTATQL